MPPLSLCSQGKFLVCIPGKIPSQSFGLHTAGKIPSPHDYRQVVSRCVIDRYLMMALIAIMLGYDDGVINVPSMDRALMMLMVVIVITVGFDDVGVINDPYTGKIDDAVHE